MEERMVLFYDGSCGFCNRTVAFLLKNKRTNTFYFAALQSDYAIAFLSERNLEAVELSTAYLYKEGKLHQKADVFLQLISSLNRVYFLCYIFYIFPRFIRNSVYSLIAKFRYKLAGTHCYLPTEEERRFFLS